MNESITSSKPKLIALVGPTAVGKTAISLEMAKRYGCEIISGDSMQVYRGMNIGTAKASAAELSTVPHHLIDIRDPSESFSVSDFQQLAKEAIDAIHARGRIPFLVGGTGLYVKSVCYAYDFSDSGADEAFRQEMERYAEEYGVNALHEKLREADPASAERLHPNDTRRVVRALEIARLTGQTLSEQLALQNQTSPYDLHLIGLTMDRAKLYARIEARIDLMLEQGLIEEVQGLLDAGMDASMTAMQGLGYKEIVQYLLGTCTLDEATALLKRDTRRFAKRQLSWFRQMKDIQWVDVTEQGKLSEHLHAINDILAGKIVVHTEYN